LNRRHIGTYNILDGAADRADGQLAMLAEADLDLLFLVEAMGPEWAEDGALRRLYESRLGMWSRGRQEPGDGDGTRRFCIIFGRHGRFRPGRYKPLRTRTPHWRGTGMLEMTTDGYPHTITGQADRGYALDPDIRLAAARHTARYPIPSPASQPATSDRTGPSREDDHRSFPAPLPHTGTSPSAVTTMRCYSNLAAPRWPAQQGASPAAID
jgi:hypothetical protein